MTRSAEIARRWRRASVRKAVQVAGVSLGLLLFCMPAFSQLNYGRVFGAITDQTGAVITGATVTVVDVQRGISHPLTSDSAGEYNAESLLPGTYTVRAEANGFQTVERPNIPLEVGQNVRVDLTLQPGSQTQTITVTESAPILNTSNAQLGDTVEDKVVSELPMESRQFWHVLDYTPGVQSQPGGDSLNVISPGGRPNDMLWSLDGLDMTEPWANGGPVAGLKGLSILPIEGIQEIQIVLNPNAEYGWRGSGIISVGLKSGTNDIHGTAYAFIRNTALDARNAFVSPVFGTQPDHLENYGASIGGPILKNKLFYFANYEGEQFNVGIPSVAKGPTLVPDAGAAGAPNTTLSIPDAIAALNSAGVALSPLSLGLSGCNAKSASITSTNPVTVASACNAASGIFGSFPANASQTRTLTDFGQNNNAIGKVDFHLNDHNSINAEYYYTRGVDSQPSSTQNWWQESSYLYGGLGRAVWVWTPNSNWVNEARFGYDHNNEPANPAECVFSLGQPNYAAQYNFTPGTEGNPASCAGKAFPVVTIGTFTSLGAATGGTDSINEYVGLDTVSYTRGKHLFKFGAEVWRADFSGAAKLTDLTGALDFGNTDVVAIGSIKTPTPLELFLNGTPDSGSLDQGVPSLSTTQGRYAVFMQDAYRIVPRVTANLGLRYEYAGPIVEQHGAFGNFDPSSPSGLIQQQPGVALFHNSAKDFAPRLGLVWDVTGKGTTVVRAGFTVVNTNTINYSIMMQTGYGSALQLVPTGFNLESASGVSLPSAGNIKDGVVKLASTTPGALTWAQGQPIFNNADAGAAGACGDGQAQTSFGNPTITNASPCVIYGTEGNLPSQYTLNRTLGVQHAFTNDLGLNVTYIGNHAVHLIGVSDLNDATFGAKGTTAEQQRRPYTQNCLAPTAAGATATNSAPGGLGLNPGQCFPELGGVYVLANNLESIYNGVQMELTERARHGLTFVAGYTLSHSQDEATSSTAYPLFNTNNPRDNFGSSQFDARNHFTFAATYVIPARRGPAQLLEGWQINSTFNLLGAQPISGADTTSDLSGRGEDYDRWDIVGPAGSFHGGGLATLPCYGVTGSTFAAAGNCTVVSNVLALPAMCYGAAEHEATNPSLPAGTANATGLAALASYGCYFSGTAAITPPAQGTEGDMSRDALRDRPYKEWDFSIQKNFTFRERFGAQLRAEFYNVLNSTEYAVPAGNPAAPTTFGAAQSTPTGGSVASKNGGPREMLVGLKLTF